MDASRFDAWTRRRFGVVVGGGTASLLGLSVLGDAEAKKKHKHKKKKKCKKLLVTCGGKKKCCKGLKCGTPVGTDGTHCCKPLQGTCTDAGECCGDQICDDITGLEGTRCCGVTDRACTVDQDCCETFACVAGTCQGVPSDRAIKANFGSVDPADMLARVRELPISTWNYTSDDAAVRHIGPMAQDFSAAFGVGADDRHIHPADGQGVALAAIQGLAAQLEALRAENARLAARLALLEG